MKLAQIQMRVRPGKAENLRHAEALLASVKSADMAVLPEMFCCPYDNGCCPAPLRKTTCGWWAAPSRSWTAAGCTTPAMCSLRTGAV